MAVLYACTARYRDSRSTAGVQWYMYVMIRRHVFSCVKQTFLLPLARGGVEIPLDSTGWCARVRTTASSTGATHSYCTATVHSTVHQQSSIIAPVVVGVVLLQRRSSSVLYSVQYTHSTVWYTSA